MIASSKVQPVILFDVGTMIYGIFWMAGIKIKANQGNPTIYSLNNGIKQTKKMRSGIKKTED